MFTIYHNPRCSKSRNTLALLDENSVEYQVVHYLDEALSEETIKSLLQQLSMDARSLLRKGEEAYKQHNLSDMNLTNDAIIGAIIESPKLIERPIVSNGTKAVLGRPPENIFELFR